MAFSSSLIRYLKLFKSSCHLFIHVFFSWPHLSCLMVLLNRAAIKGFLKQRSQLLSVAIGQDPLERIGAKFNRVWMHNLLSSSNFVPFFFIPFTPGKVIKIICCLSFISFFLSKFITAATNGPQYWYKSQWRWWMTMKLKIWSVSRKQCFWRNCRQKLFEKIFFQFTEDRLEIFK